MEIKDIVSEKKCAGCMSCVNACPKSAIKTKKNYGFDYPEINYNDCINCGICKRVCPIINTKNEKKYSPIVYAAKNKNTEIRMKSSSGGIFTLISEWILDNNGVVFGAKFNEKMEVVHDYIECKEELSILRGTKYVQSQIGLSYVKVKEFLKEGRKVLFTGTPCQIEGLLCYLQEKYNNLYTQDIICHGVPSPLVWEKYLEYIKEKYGEVPREINFRKKDQKGWTNYQVNYKYKNTEQLIDHKEDLYMQIFLKNLALRDSCFECQAKNLVKNSDITIADFWGINSVNPEFNDEKGISAIIINSNKGLEIFEKIKNKLEFTSQRIENIVKYNSCICNSTARNNDREMFLKELENKNFEFVIKKYL